MSHCQLFKMPLPQVTFPWWVCQPRMVYNRKGGGLKAQQHKALVVGIYFFFQNFSLVQFQKLDIDPLIFADINSFLIGQI